MSCDVDNAALMRYHDGELARGAAESMARHVAACERCRRIVDEYREIALTVGEAIPAVIDPDRAEAAVEAIRARWQSRSWTDEALPLARRLAPIAAMAATVLVALALFGPADSASTNGAGYGPPEGATSDLALLTEADEMDYIVGADAPPLVEQE